MMMPIKYLTTVTVDGCDTSYFFCKLNKFLLAVDGGEACKPDLVDTTKRLVCALGGFITKATIYKYQENRFYAYLTVKKDERFLEVNISPCDAIKFGVELFIDEAILKSCGLEVDVESLREALEG